MATSPYSSPKETKHNVRKDSKDNRADKDIATGED